MRRRRSLRGVSLNALSSRCPNWPMRRRQDRGRCTCRSKRDLQREIGDVNRQVSEWYDSEFYGPSDALELIERRAYDVADRALGVAEVLRKQFGLPRRQLGQHERDIERNIHERAIAGRRRPPIWRLWSLMRFALAKHRCAPVPFRIRFLAARRRSIARVRRLIGRGNTR